MSDEPQSVANRFYEVQARAGGNAVQPTPKALPPKPKKRVKPGKGKDIRVRVEKSKRDLNATRWSDMTPEEMASFRIYPKENR